MWTIVLGKFVVYFSIRRFFVLTCMSIGCVYTCGLPSARDLKSCELFEPCMQLLKSGVESPIFEKEVCHAHNRAQFIEGLGALLHK